MTHQRGFSLVDSLVAMAIVMISVAAYGTLAIKSRQYLFAYRERSTAREVLAHVRHLPAEHLDRFDTRYFDTRGLPGKPDDTYRVRVKIVDSPGIRTYWCTLSYRDWQGAPHQRTFHRTEWRPYEGI